MKINRFVGYVIKDLIILSLVLFFSALTFHCALAEDKSAAGGIIPKLPKTTNDPELSNGRVYPFWGPPCQRLTAAFGIGSIGTG